MSADNAKCPNSDKSLYGEKPRRDKWERWGGERAQQPVTYSGYFLKFKENICSLRGVKFSNYEEYWLLGCDVRMFIPNYIVLHPSKNYSLQACSTKNYGHLSVYTCTNI